MRNLRKCRLPSTRCWKKQKAKKLIRKTLCNGRAFFVLENYSNNFTKEYQKNAKEFLLYSRWFIV